MIKIKKVLNFSFFFKNHLWKYKCMLIYCYLIWDWVQGVTVHVWIVQWFLLIRSILNIESFVCISLRVCKNNIILKVFYIHWHLDTEILTHECLWLRYNCYTVVNLILRPCRIFSLQRVNTGMLCEKNPGFLLYVLWWNLWWKCCFLYYY